VLRECKGTRAVKAKEQISELREKADAELLDRKAELERAMFLDRSIVATSGEKRQVAKVRAMRKEIARILTLLRERELEQLFRDPLL
jgi:large subunit ribosomal protein L29